jgi:hypothetical protein
VGYAKKRIDGVAAASVNDGAGGTEESAAKGGVGIGGLMGEEAVAPGLEELGIEIAGWVWGLIRRWSFLRALCCRDEFWENEFGA